MKLTNHEDRIKYGENNIAIICGWHKPTEDMRRLTKALISLGYQVSHGLCPECAKRVREEEKELLTSQDETN